MRAPLASALVVATSLALVGCGAGGTERIGVDAGGGAAAGPQPQPGFTLLDHPLAIAVAADGLTALYEDFGDSGALAVLRDTVTLEVAGIAEVGDPSRAVATGLSSTRRVSAMHGEPVQAGVWSAEGGWLDVASPFSEGCQGDVGAAWDVSADGRVVVGMAWNGCAGEAFRWSDGAGAAAYGRLAVLGEAPQGLTRPPTNRATKVSRDGRITGGFAEGALVDRMPARWDESGGGELLAPADLQAPGEVLSIDGAGQTLAGILGGDGFVWTRAGGLVTLARFDAALPTDPVYPNAMSADGTVIFGGVGDAFFSVPTAFVWTEAAGMRPLAEVAAAAGVALPEGTILNTVLGASADGAVLAGTAMDAAGAPKTFLLVLPAGALDG